MQRFWAHIHLLRPLNLFIGALTVLVCASILGTVYQVRVLLLIIGVVVCYNAAANAINDYFDYEIDLINRPDRPLITGLVHRRTALFLSGALFGLGSLLVWGLPPLARVIALAVALPLMLFYSPFLKGLPLVGNVAVAAILGLVFLFAGASFGDISPMVIPALLAFGLTLVRELVKDIADMEGDRKVYLRTFPLSAGLTTAVRVALVFSFLIGVGALWPYLTGYYGAYYVVVLVFGVELPLGYAAFTLWRKPGSDSARTAAALLKAATLAGVVAVFLG